MRLFDTIDEMKSWFKDVDAPIEVTRRMETNPPWKVRIDVDPKLNERPIGEGESISDAFELALEKFDQSILDTSSQRRPVKEYLDIPEPSNGLFANSLDELERWFENLYLYSQFTYRVQRRPRWCVRVKQSHTTITRFGNTLDEAASKLFVAIND